MWGHPPPKDQLEETRLFLGGSTRQDIPEISPPALAVVHDQQNIRIMKPRKLRWGKVLT